MRLLVLDTIHGGGVIAASLAAQGHQVDAVDVYRGEDGIPAEVARERQYDLLIAPVHLDPAHPLLHHHRCPAITHHQAVRWILGDRVPHPFIEVTGAQGKTTTATALASVMEGPGILHTSTGTYQYPERTRLFQSSITPASEIAAAEAALAIGGWLIAEVSLGVTGAGDLAVLTSGNDYRCAAGARSAIDEKIRSIAAAPAVVVPHEVQTGHRHQVSVDQVATISKDECRFAYLDEVGRFRNPLLLLPAYQTPLALATTAALILGQDPSRLEGFEPLAGRMKISNRGTTLIVDNANSGVSRSTTREAVDLARRLNPEKPVTLVIGEEAHAVCEGFPPEGIRATIRETGPATVVLVGETARAIQSGLPEGRVGVAETLDGAMPMAEKLTPQGGSIVLAVKMWR
ncbi:coenzyme F430 synthase [Methanosphaerula subterraneus]|uniref:coenzyme F430 synthase n=1 Tax=Methanosphaerula subterraneus TaxID=3350244 RepID=UPI003F839435